MEPRTTTRTTDVAASAARAAVAERAPRFAVGTLPLGTVRSDEADAALWRESMTAKLGRRLVSVPGLALVTAIDLLLLPVLLIHAAVSDAIHRRPLLLVRFHLTIAGVLLWHWVGLGSLLLWWLAGLGWLGFKPRRWIQWNRRLEGWWGSWVIGIAEFFYRMRMHIEGEDVLEQGGPILVFARHTSIIDTMLPLRLLEHRHRMTARIVKKRELLWDPCVDSISQRIPRTFVRRGSDPQGDLELVRKLAGAMGSDDGLWIFPEGTRFSPKKRRQIVDRLRAKGMEEAAARAEELQYTLPPRPGGASALLDRCRGIDVVFCAHTGMEGANRLENFIGGSLFRRRVKVELWRVPAAEVPTDPEEQILWLHTWWRKMDEWVARHQDVDLTELLANE